ncbi:sulfocyanin-like copper-binding protein [Mesorhizobium shangrilense]|uniref:Sulfocyanin-like copper-binding protein n=1 Tax=Mesorhizobium shangrilense TaxID=460060 RepID=A0ABV2DBR0_9HYPH
MQKMLRTSALSLAAVVMMAGGASSSLAATFVQVSLWDKGSDMTMPMGFSYATPGLDATKATMGMKASPATVKAGEVTFKVKNSSKDTVHEMIVMYLAAPGKPLPYIGNENRVDEDKAGDKGEVSELDPGKSGALTVTLVPGKYLLICNVPGHFDAGMWTEFTVTP